MSIGEFIAMGNHHILGEWKFFWSLHVTELGDEVVLVSHLARMATFKFTV